MLKLTLTLMAASLNLKIFSVGVKTPPNPSVSKSFQPVTAFTNMSSNFVEIFQQWKIFSRGHCSVKTLIVSAV